jgi:hypothetical protein
VDPSASPFPYTPLQGVADGIAVGGASVPPSLLPVFASSPATVVTLAFQGHGQAQLVPWHDAARASFGVHSALQGMGGGASVSSPPSPPAVRLLNVLLLQGYFFKLLSGVMRSSVRNGVPPDILPSTAIAFEPSLQATDHFCDLLRVHNRMMGHVFLVDARGQVRWQAHGPPAPGEAENLAAAAEALVKEERRRTRREGGA